MNFFDVTVEGDTVRFADGGSLSLPDEIVKKLRGRKGEMTLGIRGEDIKIAGRGEENKAHRQTAVITDTEVMGNENNLYFTFGKSQAVARVSKYEIAQIGDQISFEFIPSKIHFFDKNTGVNYMEQ